MVYQPHGHVGPRPDRWLVIRTRVEALPRARFVRGAVWSVSPELALKADTLARRLLDKHLTKRIFASATVGLIALLGFVLAGCGVYRVAAESMSRSTREGGIRCALGAPVERARRDPVLTGMYPVFVGLGIGTARADGPALHPQGLSFGTGPMDPVTVTAARGALALTAPLARYAPVRRAAEGKITDALGTT